MRRKALIPLTVFVLVLTAGVAYAAFSETTSNSGNSLAAAAAFPGYREEVMADNPVAYWRLGEASGTNADDETTNNNDGTYTNGPTLGQTGGLLDDSNTAASFDGVNDTADVPDTAALRLNGSWSVEFWAKAVSYPGTGWPGVVKKGDSLTAGGFIIWYDRTTHKLRYKRNNVDTLLENTEIVTTEFRHFVLTYDGTTLRVYTNSVQTDTAAVSWPTNSGTSAFQLGRADNFGNAVLDEVAVYGSALSLARVKAHYQAGRPYRGEVLADNPMGYWRLGEPAGSMTTAFDTKSTNDGTYTSGPTLGQSGGLLTDTNKAASFDSVDDWVDFPDVFDFTGTAAFSAEAWVNRGTLRESGYRWVVGKDTTNAPRNGWNINIAASTDGGPQKIEFERWSGGTSNRVYSTTVTVPNAWYHVVGTYDGATMRIYVNGVLENSLASSLSIPDTTFPFRIAAIGDTGGGKFHGSIDDVAVYNSALSGARVKDHFRAGKPYHGAVVQDTPVSYWRLGEASGTSAEDSVGTNDGTYTNGPTLGQTGALSGDPDTAVSFDGTNDWVTVPDSNSLDLGDVVSIEAWVKRSATGQDDAILDKQANGYKLYFRAADNKLTLRKNGVADIVASTTAITDTSWHHVVGTKNGTTSKLYIDGADVTGTVTNQTIANNASNLAIGDNGSASQYFNGLIDEVALYGTALTADDVKEHYSQGR